MQRVNKRYARLALVVVLAVAGIAVVCGALALHTPFVAHAAACPPVSNTPKFTIAYGGAVLDGSAAPAGALVKAFNPRGDLVGCFSIITAGYYGSMYIYGEDASVSPPIPGMRTNETVTFTVNDGQATTVPLLHWLDDRNFHQVNLSAISPPEASFDQSAGAVTVGATIYFTDTSTTVAAPIVGWSWDFGEGAPITGSPYASHTYTASGDYTVTLVVTDSLGSSAAATGLVHVFPATPQRTLHLIAGWNLVTLPIQPLVPFNAESLLQDIRAQGGDCNAIYRWNLGLWESHEIDLPFGDFAINLGEGYFLRCNTSIDWSYTGTELASSVPLNLIAGWNLVGVPNSPLAYDAETLLVEIQNQGGACDAIYNWNLGLWESHELGLPFGEFDVLPDHGYFLRCTANSTFIP